VAHRLHRAWLPALDAAALYGFIAKHQPQRYIEIGSGNSTKFARRAITDGGLKTTITSIDPDPRAEVDVICDRIIRSPLEDADLVVFDDLAQGDIVFFDGSHRVFPNSDVAVFFLEVLPRLAPGVLVQIHDVQLPYDYSPELAKRYYSEQYMLAAHLLASDRTTVLLANAYVSEDAECQALLRKLWKRPGLEELEPWGGSFWFQIQQRSLG